MLGNNI